jgi:hypothetical protein
MTTEELFSMLACDGFYFAHDDRTEEAAFLRLERGQADSDRREYEELMDLGMTLRAR